MYESTSIANNVSRWTGLGVKLPSDLTDAITVFESLTYTEVGYQPVFNIAEVTTTNAEEKLREFAEQLVLADVPAGGLSVLDKAKNVAADAAARRVNALARVAVPEIIEQLTPEFDEHAEAYTEAVAKLPEDLTAETLVAAGPDAVAAYGQAQQEAKHLNRFSVWVFETAYLSGVIQRDAEVVLRILRPSTALELVKLDEAAHKQVDPSLVALDPVFFTAARLGVEFGINTLHEAAKLRADLSVISTAGATFR
jgi:hypothetical protein